MHAKGHDCITARATGLRCGRGCDGESVCMILGQQGEGQGGGKGMARPWPWQVCGSGHASCVTLSGSRCLGGIHPTALQVVVRHGRRTKGAGAWDLSYGFRALLLSEAEEGTKEEDDAGGPLVSQRGVNNGVARGRLRGVVVAATAGGVDGRAGVGDAQLTRGPQWQR